MKRLQEHIEEYQRDGYTIFKNFLAPEKVAELRAVCNPEFARRHQENPERPRATITNILGYDSLAAPLAEHLLNPRLLDFAEAVMGPYVQLDSMEISGYPSVGEERKGEVAHWHRDAFNLTEQWANYKFSYEQELRPYTPPMACNCLTYLQDMTLDSGPLRVVPGSHLDYTMIPKEAAHEPHPNEQLVSLGAGDMVFTHCEILHSGTLNTSGAIRYFISAYLCRIGLPHRDTFGTPTIDRIVADAHQRNDRRVLRLFGVDEGFHAREQASWQQLAEDDRSVLSIKE